jgi:aryl-alcohol dehydrogenase-like predicted oxidoreductase
MEAHMVAKQHHLIAPTMEQPQYNMLTRQKVEVEFSQIYKTVGLGTTIWSPLASGVLTGKYNDNKKPKGTRLNMEGMDWLKKNVLEKENIKKAEKLTVLAKDLGMTLPVLAIAWCLKNDNVSTVILGASKTTQLKENFKAIEAKKNLTPEVMAKIEKILNNVPARPAF